MKELGEKGIRMVKSPESISLPERLSRESGLEKAVPIPLYFVLLGTFYPLTFTDESHFSSGFYNDPLGHFFGFHTFLHFVLPIAAISNV